ncbi:MAG: hypothetical protein ACJ8R9_22205 [Steroidobacteraceae bacterium]
MIRKTLNIIGRIVAGTVGLGVAIYLIAVAVNWRDQAPSAAAIQLANAYRDRPVLDDEDNAFIYVMGFAVAPKSDPYQMGLQRVAWLQQSNRLGRMDTARDPLGERPDYKVNRLSAVRDFVEACKLGNPACADAFRRGDGIFEQWRASEGWLLQRYQALIHHRGWRESGPFDVSAPLPPYGLVVDGQRLLLLDSKVLAELGDYAGARNLLEEDLRFWRKVLESSDILISKMIATAAIIRHFELGNLVLREIQPDKVMNAVPAGWNIPISESERSMRRCLVGEWMFMSASLRNTDVDLHALRHDSAGSRVLTRLMMPLHRPQDSMNKNAAYILEMAHLLSAPLDRYEGAVNRTAILAERTKREALPAAAAYNVVGQVLIGMGAYDFGTYARRVGDLEGVRRATLLAVTLRAANVGASEVGAALSASALHDPYHNRHFEWDQKDGVIIFRGLEIGERSVHRIYY